MSTAQAIYILFNSLDEVFKSVGNRFILFDLRQKLQRKWEAEELTILKKGSSIAIMSPVFNCSVVIMYLPNVSWFIICRQFATNGTLGFGGCESLKKVHTFS